MSKSQKYSKHTDTLVKDDGYCYGCFKDGKFYKWTIGKHIVINAMQDKKTRKVYKI
jgi:hypothetical protein